jgi:heme A synthase
VTFPEQPEREPETASGEAVLGETTVTVRRSPRIVNFMILGAVLGALLAVILTYAFPENDAFSRTQVLGFLLLACVAFGVAVACLVALILGRIVARKAITVVADHVGVRAPDADTAADTATADVTSNLGTPQQGIPSAHDNTSPPGIAAGGNSAGSSAAGTTPSSTSENL